MLLVYSPVVILLGIIGVVGLREDIPIADFTRDPVQIFDAPAYTGILSNVGAIIWAVTAGICLFSATVSRAVTRADDHARYLLAAGLFTTLLLLDDVFILHEMDYGGVPEESVFVLYASVVLWLVIRFRSVLLQTRVIFLVLAFLCFGMPLLLDLTPLETTTSVLPYRSVYLFEDGAKFAGIVSWATYFVSVSVAQTHRLIHGSRIHARHS